MILSKNVKVKWHSTTKQYYIDKGYTYSKIGNEFDVDISDLLSGSNIKIDVSCDGCGTILNVPYNNYNKYNRDGLYYCKKCSKELFGDKTRRESLIKDNRFYSFYQWCIDNNKDDVLDRWDYELNNCSPKDISYGTNDKFYFKCPKGIHDSELKTIYNFISGHDGSIECIGCKSIGQYGIDEIDVDFMSKYWGDGNKKSPFSIYKNSNEPIYIKCQEKDYHGEYMVRTADFVRGNRCPYCKGQYKIHELDSLGNYLKKINMIDIYAGNEDLFKMAISSHKELEWKCHNGIHTNYIRSVNSSYRFGFLCPQCQSTMGEFYISKILAKNNITYVPQKTFDGLFGLSDGNLSYDFYLPDYNMCIEYQGEQHEHPVEFFGGQEAFEKQQEHDRRKRQYAKDHGIELLEIWYYDFDNIEEILNNKLKCKGDTL